MSPISAGSPVRSANIFINYRREDSAGHAGRLFDGLSSHFPGRLFMDVDTIAPGIDFVEAIQQAVGACEVLIVVIGREWLTLRNASGGRRIDDDGDFVRLELETALARNIRIIPVLVQDAPPPRPEDLPPALARLARRNAIELSDARWSYDVERLAHTIQGVLREKSSTPSTENLRQPPPPPPASPRAWLRTLVFLLAGVVLVSAGWISKNRLQSTESPVSTNSISSAPAAQDAGLQPMELQPAPAPGAAPVPAGPTAAQIPAGPAPSPVRAGPAPAPAPASPSPPKPDVSFEPPPVEPEPSRNEALQLPEVTILSPKNGDTACKRVTVTGVISQLGPGQRAFLSFRTQGVAYTRGELFPNADGHWSMTTDRSHNDFDILVVIATTPEAAEAVKERWVTPPMGAHIAPTSVSMRTRSKVVGFLKSKCGNNGP